MGSEAELNGKRGSALIDTDTARSSYNDWNSF